MRGLISLLVHPVEVLAEARGLLFPWVPVFLAFGIGLWFGWPGEPSGPVYGGALALVAGCVAVWFRGPEYAQPFVVALGCVALGVMAAGVRGHLQNAPMLEFRYYGPVQGRVVGIDRSQADKLRLTLDQVVLERVSSARTPRKVRVSLHGTQGLLAFEPGMVVILTANLSAPEGPSEPGGFDFRRMAFFDQLGAVGYSRTPVLLLEPPEGGAQVINRLRTTLSNAIMTALPGDAGAFASGVMTGDRSGITADTVQALRDSNLSHLLAISGMNMAFLTAFVFVLIRYGVALVPPLALRVNSKKVAAVVALGVALFYLLLSGMNVATERAFVMVAVMLGAILLDRRALSLRTVAISACILLLLKPEALLEPGFQMSFAATTVLIAGFGALEGRIVRETLPRWTMPVFTLVLSSVLAGLATAPFAAAHFNRMTDYGLLANLLTVPVMGVVVMPAGAVAALMAPFGLAGLPLWVMELGSRWILGVAHWIAGLEGAVTGIPAPGPWVLPLIPLGGLWVILWRGRVRVAGAVPVAVALALWVLAERPLALISADAAVMGVMGPEGRVLSAAKGGSFAARSWLENDGDLAVQEVAAAREGFTGPKGQRVFRLGALRGVLLKGKTALAGLPAACAKADLVVIAAKVDAAPKGCRVVDLTLLRLTGPLAVVAGAGGLRLVPTRGAPRLWSPPGKGSVQVPDLTDADVLLAAAQ